MCILKELLLFQLGQGLHSGPVLSQFQAAVCGLHNWAPCGTFTLWGKQGSTTYTQTGLVWPIWTACSHVYHNMVSCCHQWTAVLFMASSCSCGSVHWRWDALWKIGRCGLWVILYMNWGHYFIKAAPSHLGHMTKTYACEVQNCSLMWAESHKMYVCLGLSGLDLSHPPDRSPLLLHSAVSQVNGLFYFGTLCLSSRYRSHIQSLFFFFLNCWNDCYVWHITSGFL